MKERKKAEPPASVSWMDQILDMLEATEAGTGELVGSSELLESTKPFIQNALRELVRVCYSQVHVEKEMTLTPYRLGAMAGHKWHFVRALGREVVPSKHIPIAKNAAEQAVHDRVQKFLKTMEEQVEGSRETTRRAVAEAIFVALDQDARDTREFLDGFTKALNAGTLTRTGKIAAANSRTLLYMLVLERGQTLDNRFKTVNEFHAWVEKHLGRNIAGSLERFQKFCNQIQLHFKEPGRLKKEFKEAEKKSAS